MKNWKEFFASYPQEKTEAATETEKVAREKQSSANFRDYAKDEIMKLDPSSPDYAKQKQEIAKVLFGDGTGGDSDVSYYQKMSIKAKEKGLLDPNNPLSPKDFAEEAIKLMEEADNGLYQSWEASVQGGDIKLKEEKEKTLTELTESYQTQPEAAFERLMKEAAEKFREHGYTPEWEAKFRANLAKLPQTQTKDPNITTVPPIE